MATAAWPVLCGRLPGKRLELQHNIFWGFAAARECEGRFCWHASRSNGSRSGRIASAEYRAVYSGVAFIFLVGVVATSVELKNAVSLLGFPGVLAALTLPGSGTSSRDD